MVTAAKLSTKHVFLHCKNARRQYFNAWNLGGGGGGNSFANITLAISSRCFSILLLSLGAFHKVLDLRASLLQKVFVLIRVYMYLLENLNLILIFYKSFC